MVPMRFRRLLQDLGNVIFPARCLACARLFHRGPATDGHSSSEGVGDFTTVMAAHFCPHCRKRWTAVESPLCSRCGVVFTSHQGADHLCGRCLERPGAFTRARAAAIYDQSLRTAIQALKFKAMVQLADPLGSLLFETFRHHWIDSDIDMIAPVPLHRRRFRRRGFNQAYLLISRWRLPDSVVTIRDLLVRSRDTAPQTGLDREQRRINIKKAFALRRPGQSTGRRVLLVDDVLTTGATVDACAAVLLRDGASRVDVLTLARAL